MSRERKALSSNALRGEVVTTPEQMQHVVAVKSIVFVEGNGMPYSLIFDRNDYVSTHLVFYDGDEPIGASRLRWFADFAKVERTCLREAYRNRITLAFVIKFMCDHAAKKGYTKLLTHADETYSRLWVRMFGFEHVSGRRLIEAPGIKPHYELVKRLDPPSDAVGFETPPSVLMRTEGAWDVPAALG